jgi:hypothetical protein
VFNPASNSDEGLRKLISTGGGVAAISAAMAVAGVTVAVAAVADVAVGPRFKRFGVFEVFI